MLKLQLALILSFQFTFGTQLAYASQNSSQSSSPRIEHNRGNTQWEQQIIARLSETNPFFEDFAKNSEGLESLPISFSPEEPSLDAHPFFMDEQSQTWTQEKVGADLAQSGLGHYFKKAGANLSITTASGKVLQIKAGLTPIQATDDYIFMASDSEERFQIASGSKAAVASGGIFYLHREELEMNALKGAPVPVYFLPMPDVEGGWSAPIDSVDVPGTSTLAIMTKSGEMFALEMSDVEFMMKVSRLNLLLASTFTADMQKNARAPMSGTTALFGTYFTGLNMNDLSRSLWEPQYQSKFQQIKHHYLQAINKISGKLFNQAHASWAEVGPAIGAKMVILGGIIAAMAAASFVVRMASPTVRAKLKYIEEKYNKNLPEPKTKFGKWVRQEKNAGLAVVNTTVHVMGTAIQFAGMTTGNLINMFLDYFVPTVSASNHTVIRRVMNNTFLYTRNRASETPVSARTFWNGAIIQSGIDSLFVYTQYTWASKGIAEAVAPHVDQNTRDLIDKTFEPNNPETNKQVAQDTARNVFSGTFGGAISYSASSKVQLEELVNKEVDRQMLGEGKNPLDQEHAAEKQRRVSERVDRLMQQRGLPGADEFLFDANTLFGLIPKTLGYAEVKNAALRQTYILGQRFTLTGHALDRAIQAAREQLKTASANTQHTKKQVLDILLETKSKMNFFTNGVTRGTQGIREARLMRKQLTLLSYDGPVNIAVQNIPAVWATKHSPEAALGASLLFRQSIFSFLNREGSKLFGPDEVELAKYGRRASDIALATVLEIHKKDLEVVPKADRAGFAESRYAYEIEAIMKMEILKIAKENMALDEAKKYQGPKKSWLEARQEYRASIAANAKVQEYAKERAIRDGMVIEDSDPDVQKIWKTTFVESLSKQIGLNLELGRKENSKDREAYEKMLTFVDERASQQTADEMSGNQEFIEYMSKLNAKDKLRFEGTRYAINYLQAYREAATEMEMLRPLHPNQPGKFQWLRQTSFMRQDTKLSRTLTHLVRFPESLYDDQEGMKLGWKGWLARTVPFPFPLSTDFNSSNLRNLKGLALVCTTTYLWSYYVWGLSLDYGMWVVSVALQGWTIIAPEQWLSRYMRMVGIKVMSSTWAQAIYATPYSWVTFLGMIPTLMYGPMLSAWLNENVRDPVMSVMYQVPPEAWWSLAALAAVALAKPVHKLSEKITGMAKERSSLMKSAPIRANSCQEIF